MKCFRGNIKIGMTVMLALIALLRATAAQAYGEIKDYQLGSEWGKHRIWQGDLEGKTFAYQRAALATAYMNVGATGFYLGKFNGYHVVATNHHVCPSASECVGSEAQFRLLGVKTKVVDFLLSFRNIDLTLLAISVPKDQEAKLIKVGRNFAFKQKVYPGEPLMTFGYGVANNPQNYLQGNADSDCKVFSKSGDYRQTADPDRFNPVGYKAWSFVHACDISHGDSGSALIDKRNGAVVGILWTGKFPKIKKVQNSATLAQMFKAADETMWTELNYGIPATIIGDQLSDAMFNSGLRSEVKGILSEMLGAN